MEVTHNRNELTLPLSFVDGGQMDYSFPAGDLTHDPKSGLIVSFVLHLKREGRTEFALLPHSRFQSFNRKLAAFLASFGLGLSAGKLVELVEKGSKRNYASFGAFLVTTRVSTSIYNYLQELETKQSGYYSLNEAHELAINQPMYMPKEDHHW